MGLLIKIFLRLALNKAVICTSLGIHNLAEKGQPWLETALGNQRKTVLAGVHGCVVHYFCVCYLWARRSVGIASTL